MDNITAKVSCFARAYHFENNKTHIFADGVAARLLGDDSNQLQDCSDRGEAGGILSVINDITGTIRNADALVPGKQESFKCDDQKSG